MQSYLFEHEGKLRPKGTDYISLIEKSGHLLCLQAIYRIFFERKDPKKNLVWIHGEPNSGKSSLIQILKEIFCTADFNFQDKYCTLQEPKKKN